MASPGTVISAEASVDISVQHVDVSLQLQPSVDDSTVLVTLDTQQITLPVYAPDASGTYQGGDGFDIIDPRTTGEIDEGLTPSIPVDSFETVTIPTYYGDNQQFTIPVLPVYSIPFTFKVDTRNLAYSSYDYRAARSFDIGSTEVITIGDLVSTQTSGRAGSSLPTSLGYNIGDTVPRSPMTQLGAPSATPSSGATVTSSNGDSVTSPAATVISSAVNQYTLPTIKGGTYNFQVSWGDGTNSSIDSWDHPDVVHTYATGGEYDISITGTFEGVMFSRHGDEEAGGTGNVDCLKLLEVSSWGAQTYLDIDVQVRPFHPLSTPGTLIRDTSGTTGTNDNSSGVFDGCVNWNDVSGQKPNFKYISDALHANSGFASSGGKHWGSSNNPRMFRWNKNMAFDMGVWGPEDEPFIGGSHYGMFGGRGAIPEGSSDMKLNFYWTDADPGYLAYTSGVIRLADNSGNFINTTLSFDTTNWTMDPNGYSLQASFSSLRGFDGDVSGLVVPGASTMSSTFQNCTSFTGKGVETWDTSTVKNSSSDPSTSNYNRGGFTTAFSNCDSFNKSVAHFVFNNRVTLSGMFAGCAIFNQSFSDWDVKNVSSTNRLVKGCPYNNGGEAWTNAHWKLNLSFVEMFMDTNFNQDVRKWILPNSTDVPERFNMQSMFRNTLFNRPIDTFEEDGVKYWDMSNCKDISFMFRSNLDFNQPLSNWDVSNVTNFAGAFERARAFNQPLNSWDTSGAIDMKNMFNDARVFNQPLNNWDVSNVTNMQSMFYTASVFEQDLGSWDVSNVKRLDYMFLSAVVFTGQGLDQWDVGNCTHMSHMFYNTKISADLSSWDVSKVINMDHMFYNVKNYNANVESWNTQSNTTTRQMFYANNSFNRDLSNWDMSNVTDARTMFAACGSFDQDLSGWDLSGIVQITDGDGVNGTVSTGNATNDNGDRSSGIVNIFAQSGMSKANLDATISDWCDNSGIVNGAQLGTIPLDGTSETLDSSTTITKMQDKNMTAKYTNGNFVY